MARYEAPTLNTLQTKEQIEVRIALDRQINIALEMKRREQAENERSTSRIQPNHLAFRSAYPLRQFIYDTFPILEPGREYKDNWHIDAISEMLEAATIGEIRQILINLPRRCMKSTLVSVMWFCWSWTFLPHTRWLFASFSEKFAYRDSNLCRKLMESLYYQQRFGHVFEKSLTDWKTSRFANNKGGFRACFGVTKGTGDGGDFAVVDDPHQIDEAESEKKIETTINWYFETYYNNVTDPKTAVRAIMHQRVGEDDLTGAILARELNYELLCLPMKFEDDHPHKNSISKPLRLGKVNAFEKKQNPSLDVDEEKLWIDPRDPKAPEFTNKWYRAWYQKSFAARGLKSEGEGQILWPNRFNEDDIRDIVAHLQAYGESSQLQQRPIRRGGNFFHIPDFKPYVAPTEIDLSGMTFVRVWDKAGTQGAGDWTVGTLLGRTEARPFTIYVLDVFRAQIGYYERMSRMKQIAEQDYIDYIENGVGSDYSIVIERELASAGKDLATIEKDYLQGYDVRTIQPRGKKSIRAKPAKSMSEARRIKVLRAHWNAVWEREMEKFDPNKENQADDQVDTLAYGVQFLIFGVRSQRVSASGTT